MYKIGLFWRTITQLSRRQLFFQLRVRLCGRPRLRFAHPTPTAHFLVVLKADKPVSWHSGTFTFLVKSYSPGAGPIDWNCRHPNLATYGKLWTYNLNYFDFLNQPDVNVEEGLALIQDFMDQTHALEDGLESYPTSVRIVNWIQFLSRHQIHSQAINRHLAAQVDLLSYRLEYHIGGNHLLENGFALLLGALFFRHIHWFQKAVSLLDTELTRQILADGGHDERSPMYHQLLLDRLLTVVAALQFDTWQGNPTLLVFLTEKAQQMLAWLNAISFANGDIPLVKDSTLGVAPTMAQLRAKARHVLTPEYDLVVDKPVASLKESGYRLFRTARYELFADVGPPGSRVQPGHAHADTFSLVLYVDNHPVLVDSSTSTYQIGPRRDLERSTAAHNTVEVGSQNSSEVWAGFRVGRQARVTVITDSQTKLKARHTGYHHLGVIHEREWSVQPTCLTISDQLIRSGKRADLCGVARFHFHPDVVLRQLNDGVMAGPLQLSFVSKTKPIIRLVKYHMAEGFNRLRPGKCLEVLFTISLQTTISLSDTSPLTGEDFTG
ncbi:hypothetical protein GCM10027085_50310 [Spirosoma aerophilum]